MQSNLNSYNPQKPLTIVFCSCTQVILNRFMYAEIHSYKAVLSMKRVVLCVCIVHLSYPTHASTLVSGGRYDFASRFFQSINSSETCEYTQCDYSLGFFLLQCAALRIHISKECYEALSTFDEYTMTARGEMNTKVCVFHFPRFCKE